jgi:hypothetical protein
MLLKELRMLDEYFSNLAMCADVNMGRLRGMKSYDSNVLKEHLIPIVSCSLPNHVLNSLTEISQLFKDFCASTLRMDELVKMDQNILIILCKLEHVDPISLSSFLTSFWGRERILDEQCRDASSQRVHVTINCTEVGPYLEYFQRLNVGNTFTNFPEWFKDQVKKGGIDCTNISFERIS